jgi:hypothetical protein
MWSWARTWGQKMDGAMEFLGFLEGRRLRHRESCSWGGAAIPPPPADEGPAPASAAWSKGLMGMNKKMLKLLSRLVYKGLKACVSEWRRPNTANPEDLVRRRYVVGKADQTSSNIKAQVSNRWHPGLQSWRILTTASDVMCSATWRGYLHWTLFSSVKVLLRSPSPTVDNGLETSE